MVKLQKRLARKRYLNSKRVYEYERISLHIPKEFHEAIKPYLEEDLDLKVTTEKDSRAQTNLRASVYSRASSIYRGRILQSCHIV
jgi:CO dehydrogenase/acetyl-CoA synthase beta subunit